jgi:hypothetical protein
VIKEEKLEEKGRLRDRPFCKKRQNFEKQERDGKDNIQ